MAAVAATAAKAVAAIVEAVKIPRNLFVLILNNMEVICCKVEFPSQGRGRPTGTHNSAF